MPFVGGGNASGGTAQSLPSVPKAEYQGKAPQLGSTDYLNQYFDLKMKKAGTSKLEEEAAAQKLQNEIALLEWAINKGLLPERLTAEHLQKLSESGISQINFGREKGKDAEVRNRAKTQTIEDGINVTAGMQLEKERK